LTRRRSSEGLYRSAAISPVPLRGHLPRTPPPRPGQSRCSAAGWPREPTCHTSTDRHVSSVHDPARLPAHDPVITWTSGPRIRTLQIGQRGRTNPDRTIFRYHADCHRGRMGRRSLGGYRVSSSEQRRLQKVTGLGWRCGVPESACAAHGVLRADRPFAAWQRSRRLSAVTGRRVRRSVPAAGRRGRSGGRTPRSCGQALRAARWCPRLA
jgi:hypothetical protein